MGFLICSLLAAIPAWASLTFVFNLSFHDDRYTHIAAIPFLCGSLIYLERKAIFLRPGFFFAMAPPLIVLEFISFHPAVRKSPPLGISVFVLCVIAGFGLFYGKEALGKSVLPIFLLALAIPVPAPFLDRAVLFLQEGSADIACLLFKLAGVPVLRRGFQLSLPGVEIEIAGQCSGIRSSIALFITALIAGQLFLRSGWSKLSLALLVIPVAVFKNAVRIATISYLGVYVDTAFFYGRLHRYGGLPFSLLALAMLSPCVFVFYKLESRRRIRR